LYGEIQWPRVEVSGVPQTLLPHDIRIDHAGETVYASFGMWEADISNLDNPASWTVTNHTCEILAQSNPIHEQVAAAEMSLCDYPEGQAFILGATPMQASLLWPQLSHSPETNGDDSRLFLGDQAGGTGALWEPETHVRVIDLTQDPPQLVAEAPGAGHSLDWFQLADGRELLLHANEGGTGDTCQAEGDRPESLGWAFSAPLTEVTDDEAHRVSTIELAINRPEFCEEKAASGQDTSISYHSIDDPTDASFAMVSFGAAGLRLFDIRDPESPTEVAYFNHGPLVHAGVASYDADRGLIYMPGGSGFTVLEIDAQVSEHLGLDD
jgi:hypothetical protein